MRIVTDAHAGRRSLATMQPISTAAVKFTGQSYKSLNGGLTRAEMLL